jgi:hypothetical protein
LIKQILDFFSKLVAKMKPAHFICFLAVLIIAIILMYLLSRPPVPKLPSRPIAVWFSEMGAGTDPNSYLLDDTKNVIDLIKHRLNVFDVKLYKPEKSKSGTTRANLEIMIGCYQPDKTKLKELRAAISELEESELSPKPYETLSNRLVDLIIQDIRKCILGKYPPAGTICDLQSLEEKPSDPEESPLRKIYIDVGFLAGVREKDVFRVVPIKSGGHFLGSKEIVILEVNSGRSMALVPWEQQIEIGWGVEWKRSGS